MRTLLWLSLFAFASPACTIVNPPGWDGRAQEPNVLAFQTRFGQTPWFDVPASASWPRGRQIGVHVHRHSIVHGMGIYAATLEFLVFYRDEPGSGIRCVHEPSGHDVPASRFGCWTHAGTDPPLEFWLAPGHDCPSRHSKTLRTLTTPECWIGELNVGQQKIQLKHAYLQRAGVPVGRISWLFADNTPLLAANIVHPHRIEIYDLNAPLSDDLRQSLLLLTVALGWYEDAVSPDAS